MTAASENRDVVRTAIEQACARGEGRVDVTCVVCSERS
jgi:hypothetical protein